MAISPVHFNRNLFCAIDSESTGLDPLKHDMIQLSIIPLGPDFKPTRDFQHFEILIKPDRPENGSVEAEKVNKGLLNKALTHGFERWASVEMLRHWFYSLKLPERKKIVPLAANYQHDRDFIREWMGGQASYEEIFRNDYRDVQEAARVVNDMCDWASERIPFPKQNLSYLCSTLGVENINKHDASGDALATAEVYRRLMRYKDYWNNVPIPPEQVFDDSIVQLLGHIEKAPDQRHKLLAVRNFLARTGR